MEILYNVYKKEETRDYQWAEIEVNNHKYDICLSSIKECLLLDSRVDFSIDYQIVELHGKTFYIFTDENRLYITPKLNIIWKRKTKLFCHITKKFVYFFGICSDIENVFQNCDNVYLEDKIISKVIRPFKKWKFKNIAVIKISLEDIKATGSVNNRVFVGDGNNIKLPLALTKKHKGTNFYKRKCVNPSYFLVRSVVSSGIIRLVCIPMVPEYKKINIAKDFLAHAAAKFVGIFKRIFRLSHSVLFFEKRSNTASSSAFYTFQKIMEKPNIKNKLYFVIDKNSDDYDYAHKQYPKNVIKKYSFKHYLQIYLSKYFISTQLSNHVLNSRVLLKSLGNVISKKALIYLQENPMSANAICNPTANEMKKNSASVRLTRAVVSSDLEAEQFYNLGFTDENIIKTGLPRLDICRINEFSDKITVMLSNRPWEENMFKNFSDITKTSYFKTHMDIIKSFEKAGLLSKLLIIAHPKFESYIVHNLPQYEFVLRRDIDRTIANSKIFITDYAPDSYDAHYRGAYIIYYWKDRKAFLEKHNVLPPINEDNCDGVPVFDNEALIKEVKNAIRNNYAMDSIYTERYKQINEFDDNLNGERLVEALIEQDIIQTTSK